jgi:tRNA G18 (ribose-2'-O)-methylase SpoU
MGGLFNLRLARANAVEVGRWAAAQGVRLVGMSPRAGRLWTELPEGPIALVLGEERRGLSATLTGMCDWAVRLPIVGKADSLNVSVAAGVAMYEVLRRRMQGEGQSRSSPLSAHRRSSHQPNRRVMNPSSNLSR